VNRELAWFKSSYSAGDGGDCVEVAATLHSIHVRDSKDTTHPSLSVPHETWASFLEFATQA
jgi:hypothetical protein